MMDECDPFQVAEDARRRIDQQIHRDATEEGAFREAIRASRAGIEELVRSLVARQSENAKLN